MLLSVVLYRQKIDSENKDTYFASRFDGPADAPWQYQVHHPMEEVQGNDAIGQVFALYFPGGRRGYIQNNDDETYTNFAGQSDGRGNAPVSYCVHRLIEEVQGFNGSHWMPSSGEYSLQ